MFFFTPRYIKQGRQFVKDARKLIAYKRDLVTEEVVADVEREITHLEQAISSRDKAAVEAQMHRLDQACGQLTKPVSDPGWRENVEVFLVAIVIALAVRTYFLQPFTIPTGSMQPTLNGILFHATKEPPPNPLSQVVMAALAGRTYIDVVAKADESIAVLEKHSYLYFFERTKIITSVGNEYWIPAEPKFTQRYILSESGTSYKAGEVIARGYIDTGDHVFVDKFTYNFRRPSRGEVFVFSTRDIPGMETPSQYYIKRLAGLPNDTLRVDAPRLFVNGRVATESGFVRVMSGTLDQPKDGYQGYSNPAYQAIYLTTPTATFTAPPHCYFAMGDNSYNSSDSRYWGTAPEENIMGRALFTYWPQASHWGPIR